MLPLTEVAEVTRQVAHALAAAHRVGVVHGGLSPAKVRLTDARTVGLPFVAKVTDFGVDRLLHSTLGDADTVKDLASPQWMAPEQTDADAALTPATDVFAFGLLTFWLLTGHAYWRASAKGAQGAAALRELLSPSRVAASARAAELGVSARVPGGFDAWLARCLAMDPTQRFADGDAAESPWYYDVPTVWDLGATTHPDAGAHNPPAEDAGHAHHPTPAEDAGHAHDPAPAEDAGHAHHPASLTPPDA